MSESTDSLTIVVSEETGRVSVAEEGSLTRVQNADGLREILSVLKKEEEAPGNRFKLWKGSYTYIY